MRLIFDWTELRQLGNSKFVRLSSLFPFVGYFILLNERIVELLNLSNEYVNFQIAGPGLRLYFLFFGLLALGLGSILYEIRCPIVVKKYPRPGEYLSTEHEITTRMRISEMVAYLHSTDYESYRIRSASLGGLPSHEEFKLTVMREMFYSEAKSRRIARSVVSFLFGAGLIALAIPSGITVVDVVGSIFTQAPTVGVPGAA